MQPSSESPGFLIVLRSRGCLSQAGRWSRLVDYRDWNLAGDLTRGTRHQVSRLQHPGQSPRDGRCSLKKRWVLDLLVKNRTPLLERGAQKLLSSSKGFLFSRSISKHIRSIKNKSCLNMTQKDFVYRSEYKQEASKSLRTMGKLSMDRQNQIRLALGKLLALERALPFIALGYQ